MHAIPWLGNDGVCIFGEISDWRLAPSHAKRNVPTILMKLDISSSRLAVVVSCTAALLGVAHAQDASAKKAAASPSASPAGSEAPITLKDPVAVVNGTKISKAQLQEAFDGAVKAAGADTSKLTDDQKLAGYHQILDQLITETLIKQQAGDVKVSDQDVANEIAKIKKNFPTEAAFQEQLKKFGQTEDQLKQHIKDGLQEQKWIESQIGGQADVTEADAKKFYDSNIKEFQQPEQVRASHILFMVPQGAPDSEVQKKKAQAEAAYKRAEKGEDFTKLAKELTEEPNGKERGGDLDYFTKDQMVPEFANKAFSMKVGEISEPVRTQFGFHVIKVTGKKEAGTVPFDQVKDQLIAYLKNQKQRAAVQGVIEKLHDNAKIENSLPPVKAAPGADQSAQPTDAAPAAQ